MRALKGPQSSRGIRHFTIDGEEYDMADLGENASSSRSRHTDCTEEQDHQDVPEHDLGVKRAINNFMWYTPDEEKHVVRIFDRRLALFVAFLYLLSFLDRSSMPFSISRPR